VIRIDKTDVFGWEAAIRGMRNPLNSWDKSDSGLKLMNENDVEFGYEPNYEYIIGKDDMKLMLSLAAAGHSHSKYRRMINVTCDITAPLYWWKEYDTYKVGTVANSCSTMHKIHAKPFSVHDISCEELMKGNMVDSDGNIYAPELKAHYKHMSNVLSSLNNLRDLYLKTKDKRYWRCMIEMLPSSYNQLRTVQLNYEVLANMYRDRKNHKLDEWRKFCKWVESLPYSEIIVGAEGNDG
jgi:hypothetical protein